MLLLKLAILNIGRNPRRSIITVLAVAVGLAALIFLWGFNDGTNEQMRENVIRLLTGHVQVHAAGFEQNMTVENYIPDRAEAIQKLKEKPEVVAVTERVKCEALVGTTEQSRGILLYGIDPDTERNVTQLADYVKQGAFLERGDERSVLLGARLASKMNVQIEDKVVIMTQAVDGTLAGYAYHVKGIFHTGSQTLDEMSAYITLTSGQELLGLEDNSHEIVVRLENRKQIPSYLNALGSQLSPSTYEILKWNEIVPEVEQWASWSEAIIRTILFAVMVVIGVSIMNTILMSVFERTREFGVMMAIGTAPSQIVKLILLETLVLEFVGMVIGLIGGYAITLYFGKVGIAFHELEKAFSRSYMSTVTYTQVEPIHVLHSIIALFILTTFISLYPAWKAGRMEPIKAIYRA